MSLRGRLPVCSRPISRYASSRRSRQSCIGRSSRISELLMTKVIAFLSVAFARCRTRASLNGRGLMSRIMNLLLAACLLAVGASTGVAAAGPDWPKSLTLGTASPGGVYYIYGAELAKILTEKLGIPVDPFPTQGTLHNVKLVDSGGVQLGLITMGVGLRAWTGTGDWTNGKQFRTMRALFPMYGTPFQAMALRRSGITTLAQLDKKPIGGGPRGGTSGPYIPQILKVLGVAAEINHGSWDNMLAELLAGHHDAFLAVIGAPMPAVEKAGAKEPLAFIGPSPEQIEAICKAMPEFSPSKIAAGTYRF